MFGERTRSSNSQFTLNNMAEPTSNGPRDIIEFTQNTNLDTDEVLNPIYAFNEGFTNSGKSSLKTQSKRIINVNFETHGSIVLSQEKIQNLIDTPQSNPRNWVLSGSLSETQPVSTSNAIFEIRRKAGLNWKEVSLLLDVPQKCINKWASGSKVNDSHAEKIIKIWKAILHLDRGEQVKTRDLLFSKDSLSGISRFDQLKKGKYDEALVQIEPIPRLVKKRMPLSKRAKESLRPLPQMLLLGANPNSFEIEDLPKADLPKFVAKTMD